MPFYQFFQEFQCCLAIPSLRHNTFQHLTLVIDGPPEIMCHPIDLHMNLVQVPASVPKGSHRLNVLGTDLGGKNWPKPVPSAPHSLLTNFDPAFVHQIFDISKREQEPDVRHPCQANDLRARLETAEGAVSGHVAKPDTGPSRFDLTSSDSVQNGASCKLIREEW